MWCAVCQQDVPAIARSANEPLICPRCQSELGLATASVPSDAGIALESFDQSSDNELKPPVNWLAQEQMRERLREIDRKLSSSYRETVPSVATPRSALPWTELPSSPQPPATIPLRSVARRAATDSPNGQGRTQSAWLLSLMLSAGVIVFGLGVGMLGWSAAFQLPQLWRMGMTTTIGAEGLLILSLTWMAARLWRNGRRVNRQLHGVDQQLAEIEQLTGSIAGSQPTASQHYYHHFSQAASPHFLAANLRGQVDQLAARVANEA